MRSLFLLGVLFFSVSLFSRENLNSDYDIGVLAFNQGQVQEAKIILGDLISKTNKYPVAYFILGKIAKEESDMALAIKYFKQADAVAGADGIYKINAKIMLSYSITNTAEALVYAFQAFQMDPHNADASFAYSIALNRQGFEQYKAGKLGEAAKNFRRSIDVPYVKAKIFENRNNLASVLLDMIEKGEMHKGVCGEIQKCLKYENGCNLSKSKSILLRDNEMRLNRVCEMYGKN